MLLKIKQFELIKNTKTMKFEINKINDEKLNQGKFKFEKWRGEWEGKSVIHVRFVERVLNAKIPKYLYIFYLHSEYVETKHG